MAWEQSTAAHYLDLADRFRKFVQNIVDSSWAATTAYALGSITEPATPNGYRYECVTAGTSGGSAPTWPTTIGDTIADGTVSWKCISSKLPEVQAWSELHKTYALPLTDGDLYLHAPGLAGDKHIYMNIQTRSSIASDYYNWALNGAIGFDNTLAFTTQPGAIPDITNNHAPKILLQNTAISYVFVVNGQRAVIIANNGTVVESSYICFAVTYAPPSQYPYPLYIGGCHYADVKFTDTSDTHSFWPHAIYGVNAYQKSARLRMLNGQWYHNNSYNLGTNMSQFTTYPYSFWSSSAQSLIATNTDGTYMLLPLQISELMADPATNSTSQMPLCELDGVYWVSGYNQSHGNTISVGSDIYYVFQNTFRTNRTAFCCVQLS